MEDSETIRLQLILTDTELEPSAWFKTVDRSKLFTGDLILAVSKNNNLHNIENDIKLCGFAAFPTAMNLKRKYKN